jgi:hypothetical protein
MKKTILTIVTGCTLILFTACKVIPIPKSKDTSKSNNVSKTNDKSKINNQSKSK